MGLSMTHGIWIAFALAALAIVWMLQLGFKRGGLSFICRMLWLTPLFLALLPRERIEEFARSLTLKPLRVLVDDSQSMRTHDYLAQAELMVQKLKDRCQELQCEPKIDYLSKLDPLTEQGFSPLSKVIPEW